MMRIAVGHECGVAHTRTRPAATAAQIDAGSGGVHQRIGGSELRQSMDVAIAHERLAVRVWPSVRPFR